MKLLRAILFVLFLLGFAALTCSHIGHAMIDSADALAGYDLLKQDEVQANHSKCIF